LNANGSSREQQVASEIQQRFLPAAAPQVDGYELQGISFPCYEIAVTITTLLSAMTESSSWRSAMFPAKELLPRC